MKQYGLIMLALFYLIGCGHKDKARGDVYLLLQNAQSVSIYDPEEDSLYRDIIQTGKTPNYLLFSGDKGYIVNSGYGGTPSIQMFSTGDNKVLWSSPLPLGSNPWACAIIGEEIYVTSYTFNKIYILNRSDGALKDSVNVGNSPEGIAAKDSFIYVACANISYDTAGSPVYNDAKLYILEGKNVKDSIKVGKNSQYVEINGEQVVVLSTGDYGVTQSGRLYLIQENILRDSIDIGGSPGFFVVRDKKAYVVGFADSLKIVDLNTKEIQKIALDSINGYMGCDVDDKGRIFIARFDYTGENNDLIVLENNLITKKIPTGSATGLSFVRVKE
jgi:outer membrane protein assembly factor BamB|uniref:YncE family protein n=1 Tax=candidate division WOR-3 bacterium TaxID=2052148 RepID=A0A7V3VUL9_UNCW3